MLGYQNTYFVNGASTVTFMLFFASGWPPSPQKKSCLSFYLSLYIYIYIIKGIELLNILTTRCVYHVIYARMDVEGES